MKLNWLISIILPVFIACQSTARQNAPSSGATSIDPITKIAGIPLPAGYTRTVYPDTSFAVWLRQVAIKTDNRVYLFNGQLKRNQSAQFAVLDIPVGKKDLQQCADAVMRLRAEYLYSRKRYHDISFSDNNGKAYKCPGAVGRNDFEQYLEKVFAWCGTLSLEKQLKAVPDFSTIQPGDVLIKGGSPGHAVIVIDVAQNSLGRKIYLLAQSYMPAQDIHLLKNPANSIFSPWYEVITVNVVIHTPEWTFTQGQLRRWPSSD